MTRMELQTLHSTADALTRRNLARTPGPSFWTRGRCVLGTPPRRTGASVRCRVALGAGTEREGEKALTLGVLWGARLLTPRTSSPLVGAPGRRQTPGWRAAGEKGAPRSTGRGSGGTQAPVEAREGRGDGRAEAWFFLGPHDICKGHVTFQGSRGLFSGPAPCVQGNGGRGWGGGGGRPLGAGEAGLTHIPQSRTGRGGERERPPG